MIRWPSLVLLLLLSACTSGESTPLSASFLLGDGSLDSPLDTSAYHPEASGDPNHIFEGRLELTLTPGEGRMTVVTDRFNTVQNPGLALADLPPFSFEFVQDGNDLVPLNRGLQVSTHPYWEYILEPGKVWDRPSDPGWSRASLPFSLQQRNANCTHNGLLTFLFRSDGSVSRVAYQVGSETCYYLQVDLWGVIPARYQPQKIDRSEDIIHAYRKEVAARLPVRPLEALAQDYPGADPGQFSLHEPDDVSTYGFVIDGIHYSAGCNTRHGAYPFCDVLDLPSYSLAKSVIAGTALAWLETHYPGAGSLLVTDYVPECRRDNRWQGVTLEHLVDMASGNYSSTERQADEFASYETDFISSELHADKIRTSCTLFERMAAPGSQFVYHTSDTYIAGTLINAFLREQANPGEKTPDFYTDVLVEQIMKPLGLSPVTWKTKRSYDQTAQPFTGFGLTFHSDDIARFALFLMNSAGKIGTEQVIDPRTLDASLQRSAEDPGLNAGSPLFRYNNAIWAHDIKDQAGCSAATWIPYFSGYGGISIVLLPNNTVYYVFSDGGHFKWVDAAVESNTIRKYCE